MIAVMVDAAKTEVTHLLNLIRAGEGSAGDRLLDLLYNELRVVARAIQGPHRRGILQPTALVHEAWLKLVGKLASFEDRRHFFAVASRAMRQVLADCARGAQRKKRGGKRQVVDLDAAVADPRAGSRSQFDLLDLNDKLAQLEGLNGRYARVVEMRFLGAMTMQEIADELEVSKRTVEGDWNFARAWLRRELGGE